MSETKPSPEPTALEPVEQREVDFYGDELTAVRLPDGRIYVAITQLCHALGLDPQAQRRRVENNAIMNEGLKGVAKIATPGGLQRGYVLRVDLVPLWLSGVRVKMVKEEIRPKLEKFQREAAQVLWEAFQEGRLTTGLTPDFKELLATADPDAVQAYQVARAVMLLARQQIVTQAQVVDNTRRLDALEAKLEDPARHITEAQATQLSQAVKAVALALSKRSGRNEYGGVYGELYRKFEVTSYKLLPASKFTGAMSWLTDWHQTLVGDAPF